MATYDDFFGGERVESGAGPQAPTPAGPSATPTKPKPPPVLDAQGNIVGSWQWSGTDWVHTSPQQAFAAGNIGGAGGAYNAGNDATRAAFDATHKVNQGGVDWGQVGNAAWNAAKAGAQWTTNPVGMGLKAVGAPKAVQFAANPTGYLAGQKVAGGMSKLGGLIGAEGGGGGAGGGGGLEGDPTQRVEQGSQDISDQLAPFIDDAGEQGADALEKFYGIEKPENTTQQDALDFAGQTAVDPSLARNAEIDRAFGMASGLVDQIMNTPSQTKIIGDQVLSQQLALGRSSPGGIGNVQAGVKAAMGAAPQLQRDAQQASINEQVNRAQAATGAAQIYAGVAQGTADRDVRIAEGNQNAAANVLGTLTQQYGMDLNYTTEERGQIGQMARDFYANQAKFVNMDVEQQKAAFDAIVRIYGIKGDFAAAIAKISADEGIGEMDAMKLVLGGVDAYAKYKSMGAL
jgi:hypothetical protein